MKTTFDQSSLTPEEIKTIGNALGVDIQPIPLCPHDQRVCDFCEKCDRPGGSIAVVSHLDRDALDDGLKKLREKAKARDNGSDAQLADDLRHGLHAACKLGRGTEAKAFTEALILLRNNPEVS